MKNIAIIPARGGSKRIPKKNIKDFLGKPIIAYSIEAAIDSDVFEEVMVSTDNVEIAEIAKIYGAKVPFFRSPDLSNDMATTAPVLVEVLNEYKKLEQEFDYCACIYPCAPFINPQKIKEGFDLMIQKNADNAVAVVQFSYPIQRALKIEDNQLLMISPENLNVRSQDLTPTYHDIGQYYCFKIKSFLTEPTLFSKNTIPIITAESEVQDIDTEEDWKVAEIKYRINNLISKQNNLF